MQALADPANCPAVKLMRWLELPAVVWLVHGVHGNEISSTDAGLQTAYHLLAAQGSPSTPSVTTRWWR